MNEVPKSKYRTAPEAISEMPSGIPFILGNEAAERFSYYGMRAVLVIFMTRYMMDAAGNPSHLSEAQATEYYHRFASAVYFFPFLGAMLSDIVLGKYRTIIALSIVYCFGHLALALDDTMLGLGLGLGLIALGAGGIKPCVSAHVGDQFGQTNAHLLERVFSWFYFSINLGAFISSLLTPLLLDRLGPAWAFGVPGVFMALATLCFWIGRHRFVHIPPGGPAFVREGFSTEGLGAVARLFVIYLFVAPFWALFDQTGSSWVLQAEKMNRHFLGIDWLSSQIQAVNPILVLILTPFFAYCVYPFLGRFVQVRPLRKMGLGFFVTVSSFLLLAWVESRIGRGEAPSIAWQLLAYLLLTIGEVLVSITCLEFSYTQAPKKMKSFVMACFLLSISLGNVFTAAVNHFIQNEDGSSKLAGPEYFLFFAGVMLVSTLVFIPVAVRYQEKTYIQDEQPRELVT